VGDRPRSTCTSPGRGWSPSEPAHHCLHGWELQITVSKNRDLGRLDWGTSGQLIASRSPGLGVGVPQTVTTFPLLPRCVSVQHAISNSNDHLSKVCLAKAGSDSPKLNFDGKPESWHMFKKGAVPVPRQGRLRLGSGRRGCLLRHATRSKRQGGQEQGKIR